MSESNEQGNKRNPTDGPSIDSQLRAHRTWCALTGFRRDILQAVAHAEGTPYGLAIKGQLETWYGTEITHGRLYPNLDELVEQGLLEKHEIDKRTNGYALTDHGAAVLEVGASHLADAVLREHDTVAGVDHEHRLADAAPDTQPADTGDIEATLDEGPHTGEDPTAGREGYEVTD